MLYIQHFGEDCGMFLVFFWEKNQAAFSEALPHVSSKKMFILLL